MRHERELARDVSARQLFRYHRASADGAANGNNELASPQHCTAVLLRDVGSRALHPRRFDLSIDDITDSQNRDSVVDIGTPLDDSVADSPCGIDQLDEALRR